MPKNANVQLKPGAGTAVLPDGRRMVADTVYSIPFDDFQRITLGGLSEFVDVRSFTEPAVSRRGVDIDANSTTVPSGCVLGQTERGFGTYDLFKLVKLVDAVNATAGDVLVWSDKDASEVTKDFVGGSALSPLKFAGIAVQSLTAGRYGWIQVDGESTDLTSVGNAGDLVGVHATVDGTAAVASVNESVSLAITAIAGTFTLTYEGDTTAAIAYNATAAAVKSALVALPDIGASDVVVTGGPGSVDGSTPYIIEFTDDLAELNVGAITVDATGLRSTVEVSEVNTVTVDATAGTFTVTYAGQTTSALAFNVSAADFTTALVALSNVGAGDVVVTGGPGNSGGTTPYVLTWDDALGAQAEITCTDVDLSGGGDTVTPGTTTPGVDAVLGTGVPTVSATGSEGATPFGVSLGAAGTTLRGSDADEDFPRLVNLDVRKPF